MYQKISGREKFYASEKGKMVSRFSVENFLSHGAENFCRGESFSVSLISGIEKFYASEGYVTIFDFLSIFFCLTVPKNLVGEPFCAVFRKFPIAKKFMDKRGGGGGREFQDFRSKIFCLTVPKISVEESFTVAIISGIEKVWIREGVSRFSVEIFVSLYQNISLENTLLFQKNSYRKFSCIGWGGASRFCRKFLSHRTETKSFVKEPFCFPEIFWFRKKIMDRRVNITIFSRNFYASQRRKFRKGILLFLRKFLVSKSFVTEKGGITFFRRKFLVSQCRKISLASLQCFRKFGSSKNFLHTRGYDVFPEKSFDLTVPKKFVGIPSMFQKVWGIEKFYA